MSATPSTPSSLWRGLVWAIRHDPFVKGGFGLFLLAAALLLVTGPATRSPLNIVFSFLFIALTLGALLRHRSELGDKQERRFWKDLAWGFGAALLVFVSVLLSLPILGLSGLVNVRELAHFWISLSYLCWILAGERRPDQHYRFRSTELEHRLAWPSVSNFVLGLVAYFWLLPLVFDPELLADGRPRTQLYAVVDLYLLARFGYLTKNTRSVRWRALYSMLTLAILAGVADELLLELPTAELLSASVYDVLRLVSFPVLIAAVRLRHFSFAHEIEPDFVGQHHWQNQPRPSGRTLTFALAFPSLHFLMQLAGDPVQPALGAAREIQVLVFMALLGGIAFFQHRLLERRARELWRERLRVERSLRQSEQLLRMNAEEDPGAGAPLIHSPLLVAEEHRLPTAGSRTLVAALALPACLLLTSRLDWLDPTKELAAALLALAWMLVLGLVAIAQTRKLDRRAVEICEESRRFEVQLASSENDLRAILSKM